MMSTSHGKNSTTKTEERRLALLICNGTFQNIPDYKLVGPAKDAKHLETVLSDPEACRFTVRTLVDKGLLEARREIARACSEAGEEDILLIYYSGNGLKGDDGSLYLMVADSEAEYLYATALDAEFILSQLRRSKCQKTILLVDGCHAGAFFNNNRGIPNGLYAITSCGAEELCADTPEGGAFTMALCAGLQNGAADTDGDGLISIDELHEFVKHKLQADKQLGTPQKWVWNVPEPIYISAAPRHVFLSYAREDMKAVDKLAKALESEGFTIWIDREGIQSGSWKERVTEGLNRSRAVVVLLTKNSLESDPVRKELAFAAKKNVPIIPVQLGELSDVSFPDWYTLDYDELHRHIFDLKKYDEGVKKLAGALSKLKRPPQDTVAKAQSLKINATKP